MFLYYMFLYETLKLRNINVRQYGDPVLMMNVRLGSYMFSFQVCVLFSVM